MVFTVYKNNIFCYIYNMKVNKYIKKNKFKAIKMNDRQSLMNCYHGIKDKGGYDEIQCDRNRNWFGVVNNGFLTYYFINT